VGTDRLTVTSYAVLGLLSRRDRPMSGYEITAFGDKTIGHFWPIPRSVFYKELAKLEILGYVTGTTVAQERLPDKRLFELTTLGIAALDAWLAEPGYPMVRPKNGLLLKLFLASRMPRDVLASLVADERETAEQHLADMTALADRLSGEQGKQFGRLAALYGLRQAQARLRWLDEVEEVITSGQVAELA
jgi:DNA-binding PadR family transcriptional regulator